MDPLLASRAGRRGDKGGGAGLEAVLHRRRSPARTPASKRRERPRAWIRAGSPRSRALSRAIRRKLELAFAVAARAFPGRGALGGEGFRRRGAVDERHVEAAGRGRLGGEGHDGELGREIPRASAGRRRRDRRRPQTALPRFFCRLNQRPRQPQDGLVDIFRAFDVQWIAAPPCSRRCPGRVRRGSWPPPEAARRPALSRPQCRRSRRRAGPRRR